MGPHRYLNCSGGDASLLMCPEERFHPNNNYDKSASRALEACQSKRFFGGNHSLMSKYGFSYADCLHNGCNAATIYLTQNAEEYPEDSQAVEEKLEENPFSYGRYDACYSNGASKHELCGPTELLPGLALSANETNDWFKNRGMTSCEWVVTMWTHTTIDNMGSPVSSCLSFSIQPFRTCLVITNEHSPVMFQSVTVPSQDTHL